VETILLSTDRGVRETIIFRSAIVAALIPFGFIFLCWSYYYRTKIELGYWPTYSNPDPKELDWWFHHSLIQLLLVFCVPLIMWLVLATLKLCAWYLES